MRRDISPKKFPSPSSLSFRRSPAGSLTLISTAPLDVLIRLLVDPPPSIVAAAGRLRCIPLRYLDVALDVPCGTENHWTYVPEQRYPFYRVGCYSNFSEKMAPEGKACLYVELSSREPPPSRRLLPPRHIQRGRAGLKRRGLPS